MKILEAIAPVFNRGVIVPPGQKFSCDDASATSYIEAKTAKLFTEKKKASSKANTGKKKTETLTREQLEAMNDEELLKLAEEKNIESITKDSAAEEIISAILAGDQQ